MAGLDEKTAPYKIETFEACRIILEGTRDWILIQADAAEKRSAELKNEAESQLGQITTACVDELIDDKEEYRSSRRPDCAPRRLLHTLPCTERKETG